MIAERKDITTPGQSLIILLRLNAHAMPHRPNEYALRVSSAVRSPVYIVDMLKLIRPVATFA